MDSVKYLQQLGCCPRCVLIYNGVREPEHHATDAAVTAATLNLVKLPTDHNEATATQTDDTKTSLTSEGNVVQVMSDDSCLARSAVTNACNISDTARSLPDVAVDAMKGRSASSDEQCVSCLGLLQQRCCAQDTIHKLSEATLAAGYDADCFSLSVTLPVCITVRTHLIAALHGRHCGAGTAKEHRGSLSASLKDAWKAAVSSRFEAVLGKTFSTGEAVLSVPLSATYTHDAQECRTAMSAIGYTGPPVKRQRKRKYKHYKYNSGAIESRNASHSSIASNNTTAEAGGDEIEAEESEFSRQTVDSVLSAMADCELLQRLRVPAAPLNALSLTSSTPIRSPVFVAGRYCKFSRELSQTPWMIDGKLKCSSSVEQLIAGQIMTALLAQEMKFLSSGREDVDVRCLGRGRPFALEVQDPHRAALDPQEMQQLQRSINAATTHISVSHLQLVDKESTGVLRFNTEDKIKNYCALCMVRDDGELSQQQLQVFNDKTPLVIQQQTPLRVLHRRPLLTRLRTVHAMNATYITDNFFKVEFRTEAGTYIKELVHGDLGRTKPNLSMLLDRPVDIIALDVMDVELDWPQDVQ
uniref:tRNA pseudouridine(55) synthase n=1 Tax=Hirondellea gigas TaxID=1518452 RepID=A0A2P2I6V8_9CRUS